MTGVPCPEQRVHGCSKPNVRLFPLAKARQSRSTHTLALAMRGPLVLLRVLPASVVPGDSLGSTQGIQKFRRRRSSSADRLTRPGPLLDEFGLVIIGRRVAPCD